MSPSTATRTPQTLFDKVWQTHVVTQDPNSPAALYIDLHLIHEVTSPQAFAALRERKIGVRRPERTLATMDHSTPTVVNALESADPEARRQLQTLIDNCKEFGIELYGAGHDKNGIVHVIGPELGRTQPGMTIVCGDSHTSTHGAFGALAFGIGTSEVSHVLATQCLLQRKPKTFQVRFIGSRRASVTAKDMILALIAEIGTGGATGHVFEFCGPAIESLDMEGRMTVCNMSIEAGARAGIIAPDDTTFKYLKGRESAPKGADWDAAVAYWRTLRSDDDAQFDRTLTIDVGKLAPMITWGTNPGQGVAIDGSLPAQSEDVAGPLDYMNLQAGQPILGQRIDVVFVGSCTNSRLGDLRDAARVMRGRRVAEGVRMMVVPGSQRIKREAEAEGLDDVFRKAGAEWREPGCSMCIAMNGDQLKPGQYAVSTSNRNFEGRQGKGGRTFLASPVTAAASAILGKVADPRQLETAAEGAK